MPYAARRLRTLPWLLLAFLLWSGSLGLAAPPPAHAAAPAARVVVVLLDNTSLADWTRSGLPELASLLHRGAVGLMNSNTGGGPVPAAADLTMGVSAHARGYGANLAFNGRERVRGVPAYLLFRRVTGMRVSPRDVLDLGIGQVVADNASLPYTVQVGAIGDALGKAHMGVAVFGNADTPDPLNPSQLPYDRSAAALVMDRYGIVPGGDVSDDLLRRVPTAPYGVELNNRLLLRDTLGALRRDRLVVVDYGDTLRADLFRSYVLNERQFNLLKGTALRRADAFLQRLVPRLPPRTLLLVLSPTPSAGMQQQGATLTPVLLVGPGVRHGLLSSGTTHRRGIVSNVDVAPSILHALGLPVPPTMFGQPMFSLPAHGVVGTLLVKAAHIAYDSSLRVPILKTAVYYIFFTFLLSVTYLLFSPRRLGPVQSFLRGASLSVLYLPLSLLLLGAGPWGTPAVSFILLGLITLVFTVATLRLAPRSLWPVVVPCLLTVGAVLADVLTGQHLIRHSPLGYDPQIGARYYGIGNEFMGVLVGATSIGATALLDRVRSPRSLLPATYGLFAFVLLVMVLPDLGTKAGGAITATAAFAVIAYKLQGRRIGARQLLAIAGGIVALLLGLIALDLLLHGSHSRTDIGRAALLIYHGGLYQALLIIFRKLQTNYTLTRSSYWNLVLVSSLITLVLAVTRLLGTTREITRRYPHLAVGFVGAGVGVVVGFFFNDTGVVAASTAVIYPIATLLFLDLHKPPAGLAWPRGASSPSPASRR